jgi:hypothetical protein
MHTLRSGTGASGFGSWHGRFRIGLVARALPGSPLTLTLSPPNAGRGDLSGASGASSPVAGDPRAAFGWNRTYGDPETPRTQELRGTRATRGTPRNSEELRGTPRNPRNSEEPEELRGTRGTPRNSEQELRVTPRNPEEPRGTEEPEELTSHSVGIARRTGSGFGR